MIYTISAKETRYAGIQFRSRLEAKWAAFFDIVGIKYQYEPVDLPGWSPDFRFEFQRNKLTLEAYCEVKPVKDFDRDSYDKAASALRKAQIKSDLVAFVILGLEPHFRNYASSTLGLTWIWNRNPDFLGCIHEADIYEANGFNFKIVDPRDAWAEAHNRTRFRRS